MKNPYQDLDETKFWRTAIASRAAYEQYGDLWQPKNEFTRESKIVASGSCFAQHVGRWLSYNKFDFQSSELDDKHNFSFATGNIYTPALLKQWLQMALGQINLDHVYDEIDGKFIDLLRPSIQTEGYETLEALLEDRQKALDEILEKVKGADIFIFTLGLTESWVHTDGIIYAMCPGTMNGRFDADNHHFKNFNFEETYAAMEDALALVRSANKGVKFLLTVSPVPLTATASEDHVLCATVYSKSVLRSCAGLLKKTHEDVDYFPSYELITTHPDNVEFFEANRREVTTTGVSYVMAHLEAGLAGRKQVNSGDEEASAEVTELEDTRTAAERIEPQRKVYANEEAVCEEIYLDQWNRVKKLEKPPRFCLVGDSQMAMISNVLEEEEIPYIGGMIINGSSWAEQKFHPDEDEFFVPLESKLTRTLWSRTLEQLEAFSGEEATKPIILTNVGMHIRASIVQLSTWLNQGDNAEKFDISLGLRFINHIRAKHITVLKYFVKAGYEVLLVTDPPLQKFYPNASAVEPLANVYEQLYREIMREVGGQFLHVRDWLENSDGIHEGYISSITLKTGEKDWMHGSYEYYKKVTTKILDMTATKMAKAG